MVRLLGGLVITVMTLYAAPRRRTGKGRGGAGGGLYPELAAYRISEGNSPNVQAEVGRLVGLLPIEQARAELARRGLELDEKAVRRTAHELGGQSVLNNPVVCDARRRTSTIGRRPSVGNGSGSRSVEVMSWRDQRPFFGSGRRAEGCRGGRVCDPEGNARR
jgi:hypothetical protein